MNKKIVVGLSGGVDSSTSLVLLKKQGWQPTGVFLKMSKDAIVPEKICRQLNIPYYQVDTQYSFKKEIVDYFLKELAGNRTPNPCVICNQKIKFKNLFLMAEKLDADFVATGHYARIKNSRLLKAKDKNKDQSYYLSFLKKEWLAKIVFPLGSYLKNDVCQIAKKEGLDFEKTKSSQDFCYLQNQSLEEFIKEKIKPNPGDIFDKQGKKLGRHQGLSFYTLGQRKGIKLGGGPYYVLEKDFLNNKLIVTKNKNDAGVEKIIVSPFNLLADKKIFKNKITVKIRYRQKEEPAKIIFNNKKIILIFSKPQFGVTPGQYAVFYQGDICLGGGVIN